LNISSLLVAELVAAVRAESVQAVAELADTKQQQDYL
jgi:hypothetical protein